MKEWLAPDAHYDKLDRRKENSDRDIQLTTESDQGASI